MLGYLPTVAKELPSQLRRERIERLRSSAVYYRKMIERVEQANSDSPNGAETTAYLLEITEGFEREAREAERNAR